MKKILVGILTLAGAAAVFAQGTITFGNQTGGFIAPIFGPNPANPGVMQTGAASGVAGVTPTGTTVYGGPLLSGSGYTMGLFVAASGVTDTTKFTLAGTSPFRTAASATALPNGLVSASLLTITGTPAGGNVNFIIAAWDNVGGTFSPLTLAALSAGGHAWGSTAPITSAGLGGVDAGGNPVIPPFTTGWASFSLASGGAIVPEPTTIGLAGLGLASLLAIRRRK